MRRAASSRRTAGPSSLTKSASSPRQGQLLRAIQERTVTPVGHHASRPVDVRIIAATNRNLPREVAAGRFRSDLFYRINVLTLTALPLSTRPQDIQPLCRAFLERWSVENELPPRPSAAA